jgi:hypothetical protein
VTIKCSVIGIVDSVEMFCYSKEGRITTATMRRDRGGEVKVEVRAGTIRDDINKQ